jgi:hypothetical protein
LFHFTLRVDAAVGTVAMVAAGCVLVRALFSRIGERTWFAALFALLIFLFLSSLSVVAGRLTPDYLHFASKDLMPPRYFTLICLCWVSMALLVLSTFPVKTWLVGAYGILFVCAMLTSKPRQVDSAADWADFFRATDAVGSGLLMDVPDEQLLSVLLPARTKREELTLFLRQRGLAMFHEPRANWIGKRVSDLFPSTRGQCAGAVEKMVDLGGSWRVTGWAWSENASKPPDDILFTDSTGRVIGMARSGLRHGYMPGFLMEPQQPAPWHARLSGSEWLGYVKEGQDFQWTGVEVYGAFRGQGKICSIK